jgi:tetratricopeptide (TPR) repeat protein
MKLFICLFISFLPILTFGQQLHSPSEIMDIMEKSTLLYELHLLETEVPPVDYSLNLNTINCYREKTEEGFSTVSIKLTPDASKIKAEAEKAFREKRYREAREGYQKVLDLFPNYSKMRTYIGQTHALEGNGSKAMAAYKKAIEENPIDYLAHWFLARSYTTQEKEDKALEHYLNAHILNRNHISILREINDILVTKNLKLEDWQFTPQMEIVSEKKGEVAITFANEWLGYAITKAVWAYEPDYRKNMNEPENFSMAEEKEALISLYQGNLQNKGYEKLPPLLALHNSIENKSIDPYILYEIFLPQEPFIAYQLPDNAMKMIRDYILKSRCVKLGKKKKKKDKKKKK